MSHAAPHPSEVLCEACLGNDADMPCAYPGERVPGCVRDKRRTTPCSINNHTYRLLLTKILQADKRGEPIADLVADLTIHLDNTLEQQRYNARHEGREEAAASYGEILRKVGKELVEWEQLKDHTTMHHANMITAMPTSAQVKTIMLAHGFTIKHGLNDLKPYVYEAAYALLFSYQQACMQYGASNTAEPDKTPKS